MEFKYLVAQEKIEQLKKELEEGSQKPTRSSDAGTQIHGYKTNDKSCQTDNTEMTDFQSQTDAQLQSNLMVAQTDTATTHEIPLQTNDGTKSKKRKISSVSDSTSVTTEQSTIDPSILKSEVYKIYKQHKDPREAMKQIKALKNCILFEEAKVPLPTEAELESIFDDALKELWTFSSTKFMAIQRFIQGATKEYIKDDYYEGCLSADGKLDDVINDCFTRIKILLPTGIEYWYIKNFENGADGAKWYRGFSPSYFIHDDDWAYPGESIGDRIAVLNIIGLTNSMMNRIYLQHFRVKDSCEPCWYEFAVNFLDQNLKSLFPDENLQGWTFAFKETKTESLIEINATLRILQYSDDSDSNTLHTFNLKVSSHLMVNLLVD